MNGKSSSELATIDLYTHEEGSHMLTKSFGPIGPRLAQFSLIMILFPCGNTPCVAQSPWKIHDMNRPHPPVIRPVEQTVPVNPPSDAVVLFDGKDLSQWSTSKGEPAKWSVMDGYMTPVKGSGSIQTRQGFGSVQLHVEWSAPLPPVGEGQDRGNSGVFLMGRYEVQVLDSYENTTYADGQAAAIYGQYPPMANASHPPGEWQGYDIVFRRPKFSKDGELSHPARITVFHNGILVQHDVELWGPTAWLENLPYKAHSDRLPLSLQYHGNPVRFRNIWIRELPQIEPSGPEISVTEKEIHLPSHILDRYAGKYQVGPSRYYTITREGDRLFGNFSGTRRLEIVTHSKGEFSLKRTAGDITFDLDAKGEPEGLTFHLGGKQYGAKRIRSKTD